MDEYRAVILEEGTKVRFCMRCGSIVLHRRTHDEWHATNDRYEKAMLQLVMTVLTNFDKVSQDLHPL